MKIQQLISKLKVKQLIGSTETKITGICSDSRKVADGSMFIAVTGTAVDGHDFITPTIEKGATAIVCQLLPEEPVAGVTYIQVENSSEALGWIAAAWYGFPSDKLTLVGVTGTNGKTTIATLLYNMFRAMGHYAGLVSTVCNIINDTEFPATHTTPDPISLNHLLAQMVDDPDSPAAARHLAFHAMARSALKEPPAAWVAMRR